MSSIRENLIQRCFISRVSFQDFQLWGVRSPISSTNLSASFIWVRGGIVIHLVDCVKDDRAESIINSEHGQGFSALPDVFISISGDCAIMELPSLVEHGLYNRQTFNSVGS